MTRLKNILKLMFKMHEHPDYYHFTDLSMMLAKQNNVKVSTAMDYVSKHKNQTGSGIYEITNDKFMITDQGLSKVSKEIKDPDILF